MSYSPDFPPPRIPIDSNPFMLTREEKKVLQECAQESFYQRCLPLMATLGLGAYYGVNLGYLKKNPMYGALPKVMIGLITGFIAGKVSYRRKCEEKILRLPGGKLKESVLLSRSRQDGLWSDDGGLYRNATLRYALPTYPGQNVHPYDDDSRSVSDSEIEMHHDSFDDSFKSRLNGSDDGERLLPSVPPSQSVSYDELRYRNREEYESRRRQYRPGPMDDHSPYGSHYPAGSYYPPTPSHPVPPPRHARLENDDQYYDPSYSTQPQPRVSSQRKNFYGDIIER